MRGLPTFESGYSRKLRGERTATKHFKAGALLQPGCKKRGSSESLTLSVRRLWAETEIRHLQERSCLKTVKTAKADEDCRDFPANANPTPRCTSRHKSPPTELLCIVHQPTLQLLPERLFPKQSNTRQEEYALARLSKLEAGSAPWKRSTSEAETHAPTSLSRSSSSRSTTDACALRLFDSLCPVPAQGGACRDMARDMPQDMLRCMPGHLGMGGGLGIRSPLSLCTSEPSRWDGHKDHSNIVAVGGDMQTLTA